MGPAPNSWQQHRELMTTEGWWVLGSGWEHHSQLCSPLSCPLSRELPCSLVQGYASGPPACCYSCMASCSTDWSEGARYFSWMPRVLREAESRLGSAGKDANWSGQDLTSMDAGSPTPSGKGLPPSPFLALIAPGLGLRSPLKHPDPNAPVFASSPCH